MDIIIIMMMMMMMMMLRVSQFFLTMMIMFILSIIAQVIIETSTLIGRELRHIFAIIISREVIIILKH